MKSILVIAVLACFVVFASAAVHKIDASTSGLNAFFTLDSDTGARGTNIGSCDFGDSNSAVLTAVPVGNLALVHTYAEAGTYTVTCSGDGYSVSTVISVDAEAKRAAAPAVAEAKGERATPINVQSSPSNNDIINRLFGSTPFTNVRLEVTGSSAATGLFDGYNTDIVSAQNGVLISSGNADTVPGSSINGITSTDVGSTDIGTALCKAVIPGNNYPNSVVLTFTYDVPALVDGIQVQFSFFSEEYPQYVGTQYQDLFAIFSNGQQIAFDSNNQAVTINSQFFSSNAVVSGDVVGTQFNGGTPVLSSRGPLIGGSVDNVIQFVVCDASDSSFDSVAFISLVASCNGQCNTGAAQPPLQISPIAEFDAGACSGVVTISNAVAGAPLSFDTTDDMSECLVFSDSNCAVPVSPNAPASSFDVYLRCQVSWYQNLDVTAGLRHGVSNAFQVVGHGGGDICGDPHFVAFDGTKFDFNGVIGEFYNIYTDPYMSMNSLFINAGAANPYMADATVNGFMALRTSKFNITLDPKDFNKETNSIMYTINGEKKMISEGQKIRDDCAEIMFQKDYKTRHHHHTFVVMTTKFKVYAHISQDNNIYVNATYLDYFISADLSAPAKLGGILGDSAGNKNIDEITADQEAYHVQDMFAVSDKYEELSVCKKTQQVINKQKRVIDTPTCNTVPDGYRCYKHRTCSSGVCGNTRVCHPWGACFVDIDCFNGGQCVNGQCSEAMP